ncbi:MAG TPA: ABC transporter substrate-binding protein [Burkholderiaceae bacterium]|nr:ABC transporter substrate-binding protein [Burkholderiaceae bacterium]
MKIQRRTLIGLSASVALPLLPAGSARAAPGVAATRLVVGQTITLQDGKNAYGTAALEGIQRHLAAVNAAGGVHGRRIELTTLDDLNSVEQAAANARRLAGEDVFILFGSIEGGPSSAVAKVAEEMKLPFFGPMAGAPNLRRPHSPMVFPVRAEHLTEYRALLEWAQRTGLRRVAFFHSDADVGRLHLANVQRLVAEMGLDFVLAVPIGGDTGDAKVDELARRVVDARPDVMINHGSAGTYGRLIVRAKALGARTSFMAVNSGSSQLAAQLGALAHGMVFSQVVPSPWERKHAISREYQDAMRQARPEGALSYGGLEGYMTAKALTVALQAAGRDLTREGFVRTLERSSFDLGGVTIRYAPGDHAGAHFVDLSMVSREGRFIH